VFRFITLTILAYFIFRWLERFFGGTPAPGKKSHRNSKGTSEKRSSVKKDVGEYIEYEEVKEDK
tara:strand:- start:2642 stop:2833 length:192 start_codon:yes stop_codon:yes gene_type:complete